MKPTDKPRKRKKVTAGLRREWTEEDILPARYLELCALHNEGKIHLSQWGIGSQLSLYHVLYKVLPGAGDVRSAIADVGTNPVAGSSSQFSLKLTGKSWKGEKY